MAATIVDDIAAFGVAPFELLIQQINSVCVQRHDRDQLVEALQGARRLQAAADALVTRIGARADRLSRNGHTAPAGEFLLGDGAVNGPTARLEARRGALLQRFPDAADRLAGGRIGADMLDALARRTRSLDDEQVAELPIDRIVSDAERLPADTFDANLRRRVDHVRNADPATDAQVLRARSEFRHWFDRRSGMGRFTGALDPERYELLTAAVDRRVSTIAAAHNGGEELTKNAALAAEALTQLATTQGDGAGPVAAINVVVDHRTLAHGAPTAPWGRSAPARTGDGHELAPETLARFCCNAVLRRVVHDDRGVPIDVGRRHRTATAAQWDAIRTVHTSCAWPGCELPLRWTQLHHILEWERGGPTDLNNLVPLCHQHHHRVHEGRWTIRMDSDRTVHTSRPDGTNHRRRSFSSSFAAVGSGTGPEPYDSS